MIQITSFDITRTNNRPLKVKNKALLNSKHNEEREIEYYIEGLQEMKNEKYKH